MRWSWQCCQLVFYSVIVSIFGFETSLSVYSTTIPLSLQMIWCSRMFNCRMIEFIIINNKLKRQFSSRPIDCPKYVPKTQQEIDYFGSNNLPPSNSSINSMFLWNVISLLTTKCFIDNKLITYHSITEQNSVFFL